LHVRGIGYALAASAMFGLGAVLAKLLTGEIDITIISLLALVVGGLLLGGALALSGAPLVRVLRGLSPAEWFQLFLLACPGTALPLLVIVAGFTRTSALEGGLLLQLNGLAALFFAVLLLGERLRLAQGLGIALLLLGGALVVVSGARGGAGGGSSLGDLLILAGAAGLGFGFIPAKRLGARIDPLRLSALRLLVGAVTLAPILAVWLLVSAHAPLWQPSLTSLWALPVYIVTNFALGYLAQQAGLRMLKAWEVAAIGQTAPIFSTIFAVLLLRDSLTLLQGAGGLLAALGGLVVSLSAQATPPAALPDDVLARRQDRPAGG